MEENILTWFITAAGGGLTWFVYTLSNRVTAIETREKQQKENDGNPYRDWETDRKSTRLNSSHSAKSRMPSSA